MGDDGQGSMQNLCDQLQDELWIASTVCFTGATSFAVSLIFLIVAIVMENKRLKKVQNEIVILRTSSRKTFSAPAPIAPLPAPPPVNNFSYIPTIQEEVPELSPPNRFPNSFSYTPDGIPLQHRESFTHHNNNYNPQFPSNNDQAWPPGPQMYSGFSP